MRTTGARVSGPITAIILALTVTLMRPGSLAAEPIRHEDPAYAIVQKLQAHSRVIAELKVAAEEGEQVARMIKDVNMTIRPMIPVLRKTAESRVLRNLGDVPYVGSAAKTVRASADVIESLALALIALEEHDRRTVQKVRRAVFATDRVTQTQDTADLPELANSYDAAIPVIEDVITRHEKILTQLDAGERVLEKVARLKPILNRQNVELARSVDELRVAVKELRRSMVLMNRALKGSGAFMRDISRRSHAVLGR